VPGFRERLVLIGKFFVAEGTSNFGILDIPLPDKSVFVSQILWGSIGWTVGTLIFFAFLSFRLNRYMSVTGSTLGAALAARDLGLGRTILFIGDGSM
jgi:pyruvate decarboxylase